MEKLSHYINILRKKVCEILPHQQYQLLGGGLLLFYFDSYLFLILGQVYFDDVIFFVQNRLHFSCQKTIPTRSYACILYMLYIILFLSYSPFPVEQIPILSRELVRCTSIERPIATASYQHKLLIPRMHLSKLPITRSDTSILQLYSTRGKMKARLCTAARSICAHVFGKSVTPHGRSISSRISEKSDFYCLFTYFHVIIAD